MRCLGLWLAPKTGRGAGGGSEAGHRKGWRIFFTLEATMCTRDILGERPSPPQARITSSRASVAGLRLTEPVPMP